MSPNTARAEGKNRYRFGAATRPDRFLRFVGPIARPSLFIGLAFGVLGLWGALVSAPADYQQGDGFRILYVHVPAAWMSMAIYAAMTFAAISFLIFRHALADVFIRAAAPLGATMTALVLVTGSLWGQPMWGTWWAWDARLTSVLILFFFYLGLILLRNVVPSPMKAARVVAILTLVGAVNLPIIRFSVEWWNTLHQGATLLRVGGPSIHSDMMWPLFVMGIAYFSLSSHLILMRMRMTIHRARVLRVQNQRVHAVASRVCY